MLFISIIGIAIPFNFPTGIEMTSYSNIGGNSGVAAYRYDSDSICVQFNSGATYSYTYASAGASNVEHVKDLAEQGHGLNSFINRVVKRLFASKHC